MPSSNWESAEKALVAATQNATTQQLDLARHAAMPLHANTPTMVAAAMLRVALHKELCLSSASAVRDIQQEILDEESSASKIKAKPKNSEEAFAWIQHMRLTMRLRHIRRLKVNEGDIVMGESKYLEEVASIGDSGKVYFKGGKGAGAWPDRIIKVVARASDTSKKAMAARKEAANVASARAANAKWSMVKSNDLHPFLVEARPEDWQIDELEKKIREADDEKPIQELLERMPHLLTALLTGTERFCIPQKRLGAEYVPDFLMCDINSIGVRWVMVELETPRCGIYLSDGKSFFKNVRKGVDQITEWRSWLGENRAYAQRPRMQNGLGLSGILDRSEAIVIVGQREYLKEVTEAKRRELYFDSNVKVHTYDWLLDQLRGAIRYSGLPWDNPFLLNRSELDGVTDTSPGLRK